MTFFKCLLPTYLIKTKAVHHDIKSSQVKFILSQYDTFTDNISSQEMFPLTN